MPKPMPTVLFLLAATMMFMGGCENHRRPVRRDWYEVRPPPGSSFTKCYAFENYAKGIVETVVCE